MSTTDSDNDNEVPNPCYTETNRKSYNSQHDVAEAWADGKWPSHNTAFSDINNEYAVLYTGSPQTSDAWGRRRSEVDGENTNFYGVQREDSRGTLWHYNTREAIRLQDDTIISNEQCWSAGFAHCTTPSGVKYRVPFEAVEEFLNINDTVFDIREVWGQGEKKEGFNGNTYYSKSTTNSVVVIDGEKELYGIYLGRDPSIINGNRNFALQLSEDELQSLNSDEVENVPTRFLRPQLVEESDRQVVDSKEYTKTRLNDSELQAHHDAGGTSSKIERSWRDDYQANKQHYRADLQGEAIVRHGEWFFIPMPGVEPEEIGSRYAAAQLDSHRAERFHGARSPLPEECDCGASSFEIGTENPRFGEEYVSDITCTECENDVDRAIYANGQIRHTSNDHNAVNLGNTWHRAVQHDREVLVYDDNPTDTNRSRREGRSGFD